MRCFYAILAIFVVFGVISVERVHAENKFACTVFMSAMSRSLFNFTGTYVTKGPALLNISECVHVETGLYGQVFLQAPLKDFDVGREVDPRFGYLGKILGLDTDVSAALYYFKDGKAGTFQTLNVRARVAHTFSIGSATKLEPYLITDYQHFFNFGTDAFAFAPGVSLAIDLPIPGTPNLKLGAEVWEYVLTPDPGRGPIGSFTADLGFKFKLAGTEFTVGPRADMAVGDIDRKNSHKFRSAFGMFMSFPFGF